MKTSHRESETGHTAGILEEIPAMFCDGLRCLLKLKIAGKTLISSQLVARPNGAQSPPKANRVLRTQFTQLTLPPLRLGLRPCLVPPLKAPVKSVHH